MKQHTSSQKRKEGKDRLHCDRLPPHLRFPGCEGSRSLLLSGPCVEQNEGHPHRPKFLSVDLGAEPRWPRRQAGLLRPVLGSIAPSAWAPLPHLRAGLTRVSGRSQGGSGGWGGGESQGI